MSCLLYQKKIFHKYQTTEMSDTKEKNRFSRFLSNNPYIAIIFGNTSSALHPHPLIGNIRDRNCFGDQ